jgi:hypothetical protein
VYDSKAEPPKLYNFGLGRLQTVTLDSYGRLVDHDASDFVPQDGVAQGLLAVRRAASTLPSMKAFSDLTAIQEVLEQLASRPLA